MNYSEMTTQDLNDELYQMMEYSREYSMDGEATPESITVTITELRDELAKR
jgi:hypothetical protein